MKSKLVVLMIVFSLWSVSDNLLGMEDKRNQTLAVVTQKQDMLGEYSLPYFDKKYKNLSFAQLWAEVQIMSLPNWTLIKTSHFQTCNFYDKLPPNAYTLGKNAKIEKCDEQGVVISYIMSLPIVSKEFEKGTIKIPGSCCDVQDINKLKNAHKQWYFELVDIKTNEVLVIESDYDQGQIDIAVGGVGSPDSGLGDSNTEGAADQDLKTFDALIMQADTNIRTSLDQVALDKKCELEGKFTVSISASKKESDNLNQSQKDSIKDGKETGFNKFVRMSTAFISHPWVTRVICVGLIAAFLVKLYKMNRLPASIMQRINFGLSSR